jgi:phospholipid/cholesterol/gamma-HCH transport system ATP-binding protein
MMEKEEIQKPGTAKAESDTIVEMKNVKKSFENNHVLKDITMSLHKGENLVVLGKSGTGKSVLIKCIVGLIDADSGELKVFDKDVINGDEDGIREVRDKTGFLFQSGALYDSMTVRENLEFPLQRKNHKSQEEIDGLVEEVLANVGLEGTIDKMPAELSGGMRKRISLARTLILRPELMLYDEPTTGLDPITSEEISGLIMELREKYKTTSIIITHDIKCARITADRILVLEDGIFIASGTFAELQNSEDERVNAFFK